MRIYWFILLNIISISLKGQDFHYSQFYNAPLSLNPALTGIYDFGYWGNDFRFISNFREQWRSIPSNYLSSRVPFRTTSFSSEVKIRSARFLHRDFIGVGIMFFSDKAGDLDFSTRQINISLSYNKKLNYRGDKYLTAGFSGGQARRSIDYSNAVFDNQWTGTQFDPTKSTGETFPGTTFNYKDYSIGVVFSSIPLHGINFTTGFSVLHFNRPNQSFISDRSGTAKNYTTVLYLSKVFHGSARIPLKDGKALFPSFAYMKQGPAGELNITNYIQFQPTTKDKLNYQIGLGYRIVGNYQKALASDAFKTALKLIYNKFIFTFSYDANTSSLRKATKTIGAFEVGLVYYQRPFNRSNRIRHSRSKPVCPRPNETLDDIDY